MNKILKSFIQFTIALFKNIRIIAIKTLVTILQISYEAHRMFIYTLVSFINKHISLFTWPITKSLKAIGTKTNIQSIVKIAENIDRIVISSLDKLMSLATQYTMLKSIAINLKLSFNKIHLDLNENLKLLRELKDKGNSEYLSKEQDIIKNIVEKGIIKIIKINTSVIVDSYKYLLKLKNKSILKDYLKICEVVNGNINQLSKIFTSEFITEIEKMTR